MFVRANFVNIYLQGMLDRSMRSGTELAREIKLTDWSMARNLSNRSSGVQIPRDICTRLKPYLYSAKCSWIIKMFIGRLITNRGSALRTEQAEMKELYKTSFSPVNFPEWQGKNKSNFSEGRKFIFFRVNKRGMVMKLDKILYTLITKVIYPVLRN